MTTRGLPGFLRRSLRRDDFYTTSEDEDEVDEDYDYDDGDNSIEENDASANNSQSASSSQIESKKGTKSDPSETSAREAIRALEKREEGTSSLGHRDSN